MSQAIPYPLDYQISLGRTLCIRLDALRAADCVRQTRKLEEALARLRAALLGRHQEPHLSRRGIERQDGDQGQGQVGDLVAELRDRLCRPQLQELRLP